MANLVHSQLPEKVNKDGKYVFYSHGYIVEGTDPKPVDQRFGWGTYDFPAVKAALADEAHELIAYHRPKNTDPYAFSYKLAMDVRTLVKQGVSPDNITLIGFSRGAFITALTSHNLANLEVNTILLAGCGRIASDKYNNIRVYGHVLSVYETSDRSQSCAKLKQRSNTAKSFAEIAITTGQEHGAFYRPYPDWVKPVKAWIAKQK